MKRVDCRFVDTWLDDWMAGRLPADVAARMTSHVRDCDRCYRLEAIVRDAAADAASPAGPEFLATTDEPGDAAGVDVLGPVLASTSGSPCGHAEERLPAFVDGELDATSAEIVRLHLEHCGTCSQLAAALEEAREALPSLAEIEPPFGFTTRVLARTSRAPRRSPLAQWWLGVLARPRASVELAYLGAILIVVLVGNPVIAFHGAEAQARRLAGSVPVDQIVDRLPARTTALGLVAGAISGLGRQVSAIGAEISYRWSQAQALYAQAWKGLAGIASWVQSIDWRHPFTNAARPQPPENKAPPAHGAK